MFIRDLTTVFGGPGQGGLALSAASRERRIRRALRHLQSFPVSVKDNPSEVRVFEMYTDEAAYNAHLETPHFKKFREATKDIVKSRKLIDTMPIILGTKPR